MSTTIAEIQSWYLAQCDGYWEHEYGIEIVNLDNPGWEVRIDLNGTDLEYVDLAEVNVERSDDDWIVCRREEMKFIGFGGPKNLEELLRIFLTWSKRVADRRVN